MERKLAVDRQYKKWVMELKTRIQSAQVKAAIAVNRELLELYWELGREICEKQKVANWGDGLIEQLAKDLSGAFPGVKGFSRTNLSYIRQWYLFYQDVNIPQVEGEIEKVLQPVGLLVKEEGEKVSQLVRQIPWGHNQLIINKCSNVSEAFFLRKGNDSE